jgi:hypothetical protein
MRDRSCNSIWRFPYAINLLAVPAMALAEHWLAAERLSAEREPTNAHVKTGATPLPTREAPRGLRAYAECEKPTKRPSAFACLRIIK